MNNENNSMTLYDRVKAIDRGMVIESIQII